MIEVLESKCLALGVLLYLGSRHDPSAELLLLGYATRGEVCCKVGCGGEKEGCELESDAFLYVAMIRLLAVPDSRNQSSARRGPSSCAAPRAWPWCQQDDVSGRLSSSSILNSSLVTDKLYSQ